MTRFEYLIVGAGLAGATCARELADAGRRVLVLEKRDYPAGTAATEEREGIICQVAGGHIFHTNDRDLWDYVNRFAEFRNYRHKVRARVNGTVYSFPINLMTLQQVWGVKTPAEARVNLAAASTPGGGDNLRAWAISQIGGELYELFVEGYTRKQWGKDPAELPASIIKRIPVRLTWNDDYFDDEFQGVPRCGYTEMVRRMLDDKRIRVEYGQDYTQRPAHWDSQARRTIYTGELDRLAGYCFGRLEYRSLRFEHERLETADYQGCATVNYPSADVPWTRIHEHRHWYPPAGSLAHTVITREYPVEFDGANEPYYPLGDARNLDLYGTYRSLAAAGGLLLCGRLASYRYFNMDQVIAQARALVKRELN